MIDGRPFLKTERKQGGGWLFFQQTEGLAAEVPSGMGGLERRTKGERFVAGMEG